MTETFPKAVAFVLKWEKWKSNIPGDKGGPTIWGVSSYWFPEDYKKMVGMSMEESREYAKEFYRREFWNQTGCDGWEWPLDILVFNCAVNQGKKLAISLLARSKDDWRDYLFRQMQAYVNIKGQVMEGWLNRTIELYRTIKEG